MRKWSLAGCAALHCCGRACRDRSRARTLLRAARALCGGVPAPRTRCSPRRARRRRGRRGPRALPCRSRQPCHAPRRPHPAAPPAPRAARPWGVEGAGSGGGWRGDVTVLATRRGHDRTDLVPCPCCTQQLQRAAPRAGPLPPPGRGCTRMLGCGPGRARAPEASSWPPHLDHHRHAARLGLGDGGSMQVLDLRRAAARGRRQAGGRCGCCRRCCAGPAPAWQGVLSVPSVAGGAPRAGACAHLVDHPPVQLLLVAVCIERGHRVGRAVHHGRGARVDGCGVQQDERVAGRTQLSRGEGERGPIRQGVLRHDHRLAHLLSCLSQTSECDAAAGPAGAGARGAGHRFGPRAVDPHAWHAALSGQAALGCAGRESKLGC